MMIQFNLADAIDRWYDYGNKGTKPSKEDQVQYQSLDAWQRQELQESYNKGVLDSVQVK